MDAREAELLERRARLLARSAALRWRVRAEVQGLRRPPGWAIAAQSGLRWLHDHPGWVVGMAGALVVLRPRAALRWTGRALWAWELWRRLRRFWGDAPGGR